MSSALRNVVIAQVFLIAAVAIAAFVWRGQEWALSALFGGAIVLLNSLLLAVRVKRADRLVGNEHLYKAADLLWSPTQVFVPHGSRKLMSLAGIGLVGYTTEI